MRNENCRKHRGEVREVGKRHKKKKTASDTKQSFSFEPLILGRISKRNCDDIIDEHEKIFKQILDARGINHNGVL